MGFDSNQTPKMQKQIPPQGLQLAVCYSIINIGTHDEQFPGKPVVSSNKVHFSWELPNLPLVVFDAAKGGQPMALFQEYTVAAGDKAKLPKMLCSWGNMPSIKSISADLLKMFLGQSCMLNIVHKASATQKDDKTGFPIMYANIGTNGLAVMPRMAEIPKPSGTINPVLFLDLDHFNWETFEKIPAYLQKKIQDSKEWSGIIAKYPKPVTAAQPSGTTQYHTAGNSGQQFDSKGMAMPQQTAMQPNTNFETTSAPVVVGDNTKPAF